MIKISNIYLITIFFKQIGNTFFNIQIINGKSTFGIHSSSCWDLTQHTSLSYCIITIVVTMRNISEIC